LESDAGGVREALTKAHDGFRPAFSAHGAHPAKTENTTPLVSLSGVSFTYSGETRASLRQIDLEVNRGSITTVAGASGSGKTTLANVITGIAPHTYSGTFEGNVTVDGVDPRLVELNDTGVHVGLVFQNPELMFCNLRLEDEVAFGPENMGLEPALVRAATERSLAEVGLAGYGRRIVWQLSGGQIQKLGIACVLAMAPKVLVFDEPTANLDPAAVDQVSQLAFALRDAGHAVIVLSKEVDEFAAQADQLVVLEDGAVQFAGRPREVLSEHGKAILDSGSLWLPQPTELAFQIGIELREDNVPVTADEVLLLLQPLAYRVPNVVADPPPADPVVVAKHLRYEYGPSIVALDDVSFSIPAGRFTAIIGRNGAGKSTLAKLMSGLVKPTSGDLVVAGKSVKNSSAKDLAGRIGLVFQNPEHQFLTDTVFDEVAYTLRVHGLTDPGEIEASVESLLRLLDLQSDKRRHPFGLSAGKKRRVGVAAMLAADPKVLIVDEPTYGQDRGMTVSLMQLMENMRSRGVTVILITHDMRLVQEYADHTVVMAAGHCVFEGSVADLNQHDEVLETAALRRPALDVVLDHLRKDHRDAVRGVRRVADLASLYAVMT
jgi:energy-coupling factor transport system ATP-binding protein